MFTLSQAGLLHPFSCYLSTTTGWRGYTILPKIELRLIKVKLFILGVVLLFIWKASWRPGASFKGLCFPPQYTARSSARARRKVSVERRISISRQSSKSKTWVQKHQRAPTSLPTHWSPGRLQDLGPGCGPASLSSCAPRLDERARGALRPASAPPPPQSLGAPSCRLRNDDATSCFWGPRLLRRLC